MDQDQNDREDAEMIADVRKFTERVLTPIVQRLRTGPMTPTRLELAQQAREAAGETYDLLDQWHTDSVLAETVLEDDAINTIEPERITTAMRPESLTPDDNELIAEIRTITGWGYGATRAFVAHVDALPTVLRRRGFIVRRFADLEKDHETIPQSVLEMRNHRSSERFRQVGSTTYERADYQILPTPEPQYRTPSNHMALAVWAVYSSTRSAQSMARSVALMRRQMVAA